MISNKYRVDISSMLLRSTYKRTSQTSPSMSKAHYLDVRLMKRFFQNVEKYLVDYVWRKHRFLCYIGLNNMFVQSVKGIVANVFFLGRNSYLQ